MRKIKIGSKNIVLRASPLALVFYKQIFDRDLLVDITKLELLSDSIKSNSLEGLDVVLLLQVAFVMAKCVDKTLSSDFEAWVESFEYIDYGDLNWIIDVVEVAVQGFFRSAGSPAPKPKGGKSK